MPSLNREETTILNTAQCYLKVSTSWRAGREGVAECLKILIVMVNIVGGLEGGGECG